MRPFTVLLALAVPLGGAGCADSSSARDVDDARSGDAAPPIDAAAPTPPDATQPPPDAAQDQGVSPDLGPQDPVPPDLVILAPERATHQEALQAEVRLRASDDLGLERLTLQSLPLDPGAGPEHQVIVPLQARLEVIVAEATDVGGNLTREHVSILAGPLRDPAETVDRALRMKIGAPGFMAIGRVAATYFDTQDLSTLLGEDALGAGPLAVRILRERHQTPSTFEFTPTDDRVIEFHVQVNEVVAETELVIARETYPIGLGVQRIDVTGELTLVAEGGRFVAAVQNIVSQLDGLEVDFAQVPDFQDNPERGRTLLEDAMQEVVLVMIEQFLPGFINDLLARVGEPLDLNVLGAALQLEFSAETAVIDRTGLSATIGAAVELLNPPEAAPPLTRELAGYVGGASDWAGVPAAEHLGLAVDDDLLNLLLYQLWRAGVLGEGLPLDRAAPLLRPLLTRFYDDLGGVTLGLTLDMTLPPDARAAQAEDGSGLVRFAIGDARLQVFTDDDDRRVLLDGFTSLLGHATVKAEADEMGDTVLALEFADFVGLYDVTTESLRADEDEVESAVQRLLETIGALAPTLIGQIPLPTFEFLPLTNLQVGVAGPDGDFLEITATIGE